MIIYKDVLSGDEIISDTYDLKDINDVVYEVDCKMITPGQLEINTGANASEDPDAEREDDGMLDDKPAQVNDVIDGFRLNQLPPFADNKDFARNLNEYTRYLTTQLKKNGMEDDRIKAIKDGINGYAKKMVKTKKISEYEPYVGESMADKAMPIYLNYRPDGETPFFTIWKHGLTEMKV